MRYGGKEKTKKRDKKTSGKDEKRNENAGERVMEENIVPYQSVRVVTYCSIGDGENGNKGSKNYLS